VKVLCPRGHRIADITRGEDGWLIEIPRPDTYIMLTEDRQVVTDWPRYPPREALGARPWRILACPRECMLERSWYRVESDGLQRLADTGASTHRIPHPAR
jgi:hypothetical protein